ncbi:mitochondrial pyruvate carrier 2-like [Teleopsis dalmanni]|uniref:mitochondrial pyruvate carrier 2-like n=1 Tax=Teleopsis dalmanni TaxID=139649 RepID=UPI0018CD6D05|nr:mitochondrial pyruvate carrier 2-like [Teleopsis dalmanni]
MASTTPSPAGAPVPPPVSASTGKGLPSRVYNGLIGSVDKYVPAKLRPLWVHPAGPKTIFFWAPIFKWGLVVAGLSDLVRPADTLSVQQCGALAATGIIWSRYSLVIIPKNWGLFSVNLFVGLTQCVQLARAYMYQMEQKKLQATAEL